MIDLKKLESLIEQLNNEQKEAVCMQEKSALIIAGAGSGKTKVLTSRIAYLIAKQALSPDRILAVTFTNKAAKEMLERLELIGVPTKGMWVGTFHSICNRLLRKYYQSAKLPAGFQILDTDDSKALVRRIYKEHGWVAEKEESSKSKGVNDFVVKEKDSLAFIMTQKEAGVRPHQYLLGQEPDKDKERFKLQVFELYEKALQKEGSVDFPELLLKTVELLETQEPIRHWVQSTFKHILIDEFQDTNGLQYRWLKILSGQKNAVFAVGDDDQCLAKGTLVMTPVGEVPIERLSAGSLVLCSNGKDLCEKPIVRVHVGFEPVLNIKGHDFCLSSTHEHMHLRFEEHLPKSNAVLLGLNGAIDGAHYLALRGCESSVVEYIHSLCWGSTDVHLERYASQGVSVVSQSASALHDLVKRLQKIYPQYEYRFYTYLQGVPFEHVVAKSLRVGDKLLGADGILHKVELIEDGGCSAVYDLDVQDHHNFIANGVFTHNSIYGFRGAQVKNMSHFLLDFNVEKKHTVRLEQNYRSCGAILKAANALIKKNKDRMGKNLWTQQPDGRPIMVQELPDEQEEASFVLREITRLHKAGVALSECAILYRTNAQSRVLEQECLRRKLKYKIYGGLRFFERAEIKNAIAYLRIVANPMDDSAFLRVVNLPARGVGEKTLEKVMLKSKQLGGSLWDGLALLAQEEGSKLHSGLMDFYQIIEGLKKKKEGLSFLIEHCVEASGLKALYLKENDSERVENLMELVSSAVAFEQEAQEEDSGLAEYLSFAALQAGEAGAKDGEDAIQMLTVHASKGLEYEHVYLVGLEQGLFPHVFSTEEGAGAKKIGEQALNEERRLMYVAITRAKKELTITFAQKRTIFGKTNYSTGSLFLAELPGDVVQFNVMENSSLNLYGGGSSQRGLSRESDANLFSSARRSERPALRSVREQFSEEFTRARNSREPLRSVFEISKEESSGGYRVGQQVEHNKFGVGTVRRVYGKGEEASVEIDFEQAGRRCLMISYAKLKILE